MPERAKHSNIFKEVVAGAKEALGLPKNTMDLEPIPLPHAQGGFEKFVRFNQENPENIKALHTLLMEFYEAEKANSQIYHTPDGQASFPYTSINITEVAKKLYEQTIGPIKTARAVADSEKKPRTETYYTFGSFLNPKGDAQFTFPEYAIHEYMKKLPSIWKALEQGQVPDAFIHHTIGSPTSLFGTISEEAMSDIKNDAFGKFGKWYAQFVNSQPPADYVRFHGNSMGSNFEVATAQSLIDQNNKSTNNPRGTQKDLPYSLDILLDVPAGIHKPANWLQRRQTSFGFLVDGTMAMVTRPDLRASFSQNAFLAKIAPELEANNYQIQIPEENPGLTSPLLKPISGVFKALEDPIRMNFDTTVGITDPELIRKFKAIKSLKDQIKHGVDFDFKGKGVFATIRRGTRDMTKISLDFYRKANARKEALSKPEAALKKNPIGKDITESNSNTRTFAISMNHIVPFFRESELKRWKFTTDRYLSLQQTPQNQPQ